MAAKRERSAERHRPSKRRRVSEDGDNLLSARKIFWKSKGDRREDGFTVLSYNVLAPSCMESKESYFFPHTPREILEWDYRGPNVLRELSEWGADILCIQEVDDFDFIALGLQPLGYRGFYKRRTGDCQDGVATFWRESMFRATRTDAIEFQQGTVMDRDNVALVVELESIEHPGRTVLVGNAHVLFNPRRGDIKLAQCKMLMDRVATLRGDSGAPVVVCGDFNSCPNSAVYQFMEGGAINPSFVPVALASGQSRGILREARPVAGRSLLQLIHAESAWAHVFEYPGCAHVASPRAARTWSDDENSESDAPCGLFAALPPPPLVPPSPTRGGRGGRGHARGGWGSQRGRGGARGGVARVPVPEDDGWMLQHAVPMASAYRMCRGSDPRYTTYHHRFQGAVDYVFFTPTSLEVLAVADMLPEHVLRSQVGHGLPSRDWPSDHMALFARFAFGSSATPTVHATPPPPRHMPAVSDDGNREQRPPSASSARGRGHVARGSPRGGRGHRRGGPRGSPGPASPRHSPRHSPAPRQFSPRLGSPRASSSPRPAGFRDHPPSPRARGGRGAPGHGSSPSPQIPVIERLVPVVTRKAQSGTGGDLGRQPGVPILAVPHAVPPAPPARVIIDVSSGSDGGGDVAGSVSRPLRRKGGTRAANPYNQ